MKKLATELNTGDQFKKFGLWRTIIKIEPDGKTKLAFYCSYTDEAGQPKEYWFWFKKTTLVETV